MLPKNWGCQLCNFFGGSGTKQLLVLLGYLFAQLCLTVLMLFCWAWFQRILHFESQSLGQSKLHDSGNIPTMEIGAVVKALRQHFGLHS